jgi:putative nucleotidyltransferase with HDIG domain
VKARREPSSVLIKLRLDEIVRQQPLAYDIYDSIGQRVYQAGEVVEARKLRKYAPDGLFRLQEKLPLQWVIQEEWPDFQHNDELNAILNEADTPEGTMPALMDESASLPYINSMFTFWQRIESGEAIDIAMLEVIDHQLVSEIIGKMDQLQYLNQLRIRDGVTYSHTLDVTTVSIALGAKLGLAGKDLETLALGALLHDLGKLFIPKPIMFKPNRLTDKEFQVMQLHPEIGYRIIKEELKLPEEVARPALEHQELFAGGGYPQNLRGDGIHYFSQIVKIADVYDALTSRRPYKDSICSTKAIKIMLLEGGQSFNPSMLKTFLELANYGEIPEELQPY